MALPTSYNTGTASVAANDTAVTGQGTTWLTSGIQVGDVFWAAGSTVRIASVNSNTSLTLAYSWPGAARANASYEIQFTPDATRTLTAARAVLDALTNGVLYAIAGLATAADKIAYFTGQGTAALASLTAFGRSLIGAADAAAARTALVLGSAAVENTGTTGNAVGKMNTSNTWNAMQVFQAIPGIVLDGAASQNRLVRFSTSGVQRWLIGASGGSESGGNASSDLFFNRYADDGTTFLGTPFIINRSNGVTTISTLALSTALSVAYGGTGGTTQASGRAGLGLGSAAVENVGTSGNAIGKLNASNTWSGSQFFGAGNGDAPIILNAGSGGNSYFSGRKNGFLRWNLVLGNSVTESGSNVGSDVTLTRFDDAGNVIANAFTVSRSTGIFSFQSAPKIPSFTVSTLPSAAANPQGIAYVSDGTSNKRFAISDGSNWRFPDGAIVS